MPIDTTKRLIHITTRENKKVKHNVNRLWQIIHTAQSSHEILDQLHPWGDTINLKFNNFWAYLLVIIAFGLFIIGLILHPYLNHFFFFALVIFFIIWAYIIFESNQPVEEVIYFLEQRMMQLKYNLYFGQIPPFLPTGSSLVLFISQLRQKFPVLSRGNAKNEIVRFAHSTWYVNNSSHNIIFIQYHYANEISITDQHLEKYKILEKHDHLWGAIVFETSTLCFAASNRSHQTLSPYTSSWKSTDIYLNQNLHIFGLNQQSLARTISPGITLKLTDLFQAYRADLVYHPHENTLCFLTEKNIFKINHQQHKIQDISKLRGHLRTLNMTDLEKFKEKLSAFIS